MSISVYLQYKQASTPEAGDTHNDVIAIRTGPFTLHQSVLMKAKHSGVKVKHFYLQCCFSELIEDVRFDPVILQNPPDRHHIPLSRRRAQTLPATEPVQNHHLKHQSMAGVTSDAEDLISYE